MADDRTDLTKAPAVASVNNLMNAMEQEIADLKAAAGKDNFEETLQLARATTQLRRLQLRGMELTIQAARLNRRDIGTAKRVQGMIIPVTPEPPPTQQTEEHQDSEHHTD